MRYLFLTLHSNMRYLSLTLHSSVSFISYKIKLQLSVGLRMEIRK